MIVIPQILADRYREACANPDIARWRSLAYLAAIMADKIEASEPDSLQGIAVRALSERAWTKCMDMCPPRDEEDYQSLSGVIVGWFRGLWRAAA